MQALLNYQFHHEIVIIRYAIEYIHKYIFGLINKAL